MEVKDQAVEDMECPSCRSLTVYVRIWEDGQMQLYCKRIGCWNGKVLLGKVENHCVHCNRRTEHLIYRDIYGKPYAEKCVECQTRCDIITLEEKALKKAEKNQKKPFVKAFYVNQVIEIEGHFFKVKYVKPNGRLGLKKITGGRKDDKHKKESDPVGSE